MWIYGFGISKVLCSPLQIISGSRIIIQYIIYQPFSNWQHMFYYTVQIMLNSHCRERMFYYTVKIMLNSHCKYFFSKYGMMQYQGIIFRQEKSSCGRIDVAGTKYGMHYSGCVIFLVPVSSIFPITAFSHLYTPVHTLTPLHQLYKWSPEFAGDHNAKTHF